MASLRASALRAFAFRAPASAPRASAPRASAPRASALRASAPRTSARGARGRRASAVLVAALLLAAGAAGPAAAAGDGDGDGLTLTDPRITESSGLAASRAHPGVYWTHNDQDEPRVFAVDGRTGQTVATVTLRGVGKPRDMEAISVGPDGHVYVGDIGDNLNGSWKHVWVYRFREPERLRDTTVDATQYTVRYEDGPRDAEALMVHPRTGRVYIASKNEEGGGLYEGPAKLSARGVNVFRRVGEVPWVTDGAFSPDGTRLVLRGYFSARGYAWEGGRLGADDRVRAPVLGQSESVTYTADGSALLFGTEGERSQVVRVPVEGTVAEPSSPSDRASGPAAATGGAAGGDAASGVPGYAVVLAAVGAALLFGLRKARRRGGGGGAA
ncbi:WD40 repeat domain-containing protein [Streptomyces sudanensis]|uniref:WD40 repeat domain-containing protein n=1 Tax=Streptomyces sudanensis TaxID=436397 RepID=UPI0020CDC4BF|nr:WD40 repeat domain-containing protein [Streptomyces sudanensis]MCP9987617.1 WD40 repeat domain-containing protein [Streptomyces sudanensis]